MGSVTALTNATGSLTSRNEYDAFGEVLTTNLNNSPSANSIGYTGQRLDNETNLMALGNGERYYAPNYARFIQQDSFAGLPNVPQSLNRFAYAHNNPNRYTDQSGNAITPETVWDAISLGIGISSAVDNYVAGDYWGLALDAVGIAADAVSAAIPILPGGWSVAIKASRAAMTTVRTVQTIDRAANVGVGLYNTTQSIKDGNTGWAAVSGGLTALGIGGLRSSMRGLDEVTDFQKSLNKHQAFFEAKNNPEALQELTQDAAKAQKSKILEKLKAKDADIGDISKSNIGRKKTPIVEDFDDPNFVKARAEAEKLTSQMKDILEETELYKRGDDWVMAHEKITLAATPIYRKDSWEVIVSSSSSYSALTRLETFKDLKSVIGNRKILGSEGWQVPRFTKGSDRFYDYIKKRDTFTHAEQKAMRWADKQDEVEKMGIPIATRKACGDVRGGCTRAINERKIE